MCDFESEDRAEFWRIDPRTARKEHLCDCCGSRIAARERYFSIFAIQDGSAVSEKACAACHEAIEAFGKDHRFFPFPSSFEPYLSECIVGDEESRWSPMLDALHQRQSEARP